MESDVDYDWNGKPLDDADSVGTNWSGSARVWFGYTAVRVMLFAAGGLAATDVFVHGPDAKTARGWTIDADFDWATTDNTFIRTVYRRNDLDSINLSGVNAKFDQNVVNVGLFAKFWASENVASQASISNHARRIRRTMKFPVVFSRR